MESYARDNGKVREFPVVVQTDSPLQPASANRGFDLGAHINLLRRRWPIFIGVLCSALLVGGLMVIRATRVYRATATVFIDPHAPEVLSGVREVYDFGGGYWASKEFYQTQYGVIRSHQVAQKVVNNLGLLPEPIASELRGASASLESRAAQDPLHGLPEGLVTKLRLLGVGHLKSRTAMLQALEHMDPATAIQRRILAEPLKDSRLVLISIEDSNPQQAAVLANAVVDAYIETNLDQKADVTRSAVTWLSNQIIDLKRKVEESELALHEFRKANNIVSMSMEDKQTINAQTLSQLNQSLSTARAEGFALGSRRDQIAQAMAAGEIPDTFEEVMSDPFLQKLKAVYSDLRQQEAELAVRYTDENPKIISVRDKMKRERSEMDQEIRKIVDTLSKQYEGSVETQRRLSREIDRIKGEALELGKKEIEYSRLKRERDNNLSLYEVVLKREKEASLTQMLKVNNVRLLDAAQSPTKPVRPNVKLNMLAALLAGIAAGVVMMLVVDFLDNTVETEAQVEQLIGLPLLGIVPSVRTVGGGQEPKDLVERDLHIVKHPRSVAAECWRTIRTNIMFMSPDNPARVILVTSSGPREGKSTTAVNLAITMAMLGTRTLLVDTDMRRPRLHKSFGCSNDAGMSNLVLGTVSYEQAIKSTQVDLLDLLPCGPIPPNPAELLHTESFKNVFATLAKRYDRIILDSPPVGAVTDPLVLSSMVDGLVFVVHAGHSPWQACAQSRRRFEDVGARIFGVVLNDIDVEKRSDRAYYYYRHYRYGDEREV